MKQHLNRIALSCPFFAVDKNVSVAQHKFRAFLVTIVQKSGSSGSKGSSY